MPDEVMCPDCQHPIIPETHSFHQAKCSCVRLRYDNLAMMMREMAERRCRKCHGHGTIPTVTCDRDPKDDTPHFARGNPSTKEYMRRIRGSHA